MYATVEEALEALERSGSRIRVHYGDTETGQDWGDTYDATGRIGRSMGPIKIRLLIHNANSMGGGALLERSIVRIRPSARSRGGDLYRHPNYTPPTRESMGDMSEAEYERHFG